MTSAAPEWLDTGSAAQYLSLRTDTFRRKVRAGVIPSPSYGIGERTPRWNRSALDAMMRPNTSSSDINSWVQEFAETYQKSKQEGRSRRKANAR